jgi:hypothetical protein
MFDSPLSLVIAGLLLAVGAGVLVWRRGAASARARGGLLTAAAGSGLVLLALAYLGFYAFSDSTPPAADPTASLAAAKTAKTDRASHRQGRPSGTEQDEPRPEDRQPATPPATPQVADDDPEAEARRLVVGTWTDNYQGKRTMTLNDDGTGTMIVELSGMKARLFASRLVFEMEWSLENGRLKKRTLRGEPAARVALILKTMGDRVDEPILELTEQQLVLLDKDGETRYTWTRVVEGEEVRQPSE